MMSPPPGALDLAEVLAETVSWRYKGFPASREVAIADVGKQGWHALDGDFDLPLLVVKEAALDNNIDAMATYCREHGLELAPHAKTPVAPQIVQRQLAAGAWGITVANLHQARLFRRFGCSRILIANEFLHPAALAWAQVQMDADPGFDLFCLVDSEAGVRLMDDELERRGAKQRLQVLIELGVRGGRCGCRSAEEAVGVARAATASRHLTVAGVEAYEAMIHGELDERLSSIDELMNDVRSLVHTLDAMHIFGDREELIVSAGGSLFFDRVAAALGPSWKPERPVRVVLRSGAYVAHDGDEYDELSPLAGRSPGAPRLKQALELWAQVLSRPELDLAVIGFGKRDVAHDRGLPVPFAFKGEANIEPLDREDLQVFALNDHHARARVRASLPLKPGDCVGLHISHPCTTFDNWRLAPLVDDDYAVTGALRLYL